MHVGRDFFLNFARIWEICARYLSKVMKKRTKRISTLGSRATALVSVCLVLLLLGAAALVGVAGHRLRDDVRGNVGFTVVMERECPQNNLDALKRRLMSTTAVETFTFSSAADILVHETESLGDDIEDILGANPYSSEFEVKVRPAYASSDSVSALAERFADSPGVSSVICDAHLIDNLDSTVSRIEIVLAALAVILLIVSIALINNTVSLSIYGRRFIIHTMKLVGATGGFIRRPFIIASLEGGLIAGFVAGAVLALARFYLPEILPVAEVLVPWQAVILTAICLVAAGALLCFITAFCAANRYLRASYDEMFLK